MRKRSRTEDVNEAAFRVVQELTQERPVARKSGKRKNPAAVALGRKGGKKGGPARAARMTKAERAESARRAAIARWASRSR